MRYKYSCPGNMVWCNTFAVDVMKVYKFKDISDV